jgi:CheY-like chemotaxis protein
VRVVIGEDLFLLRDGLVRLLEAHGFEVVAAVGSAPELLRALTGLKPDVGIVDVRLPPTFTDDGLRVAIQARRSCPRLPLLVLSQYVEQLYARELLADQLGGVGYLRRGLAQGGNRAASPQTQARPRPPDLQDQQGCAAGVPLFPPRPLSPAAPVLHLYEERGLRKLTTFDGLS